MVNLNPCKVRMMSLVTRATNRHPRMRYVLASETSGIQPTIILIRQGMVQKGSFRSSVLLVLTFISCTELASMSFGALTKAKRALGDDTTSEEEGSESVRSEDSNFPDPRTGRPKKTKKRMNRKIKQPWGEG